MRTHVALARACGIVPPMNRRSWITGLAVVALAWAELARAETGMRASKPEVRKEVIAVIEGQLAAFRAGDTKKAYTFAAAALRAQTPLRQFLQIVQRNYPEIWANTRGEFGLVHDDGVHATVLVQVYAKTDRADYDYGLVKEQDTWRIESVLRHAPKKDDKV